MHVILTGDYSICKDILNNTKVSAFCISTINFKMISVFYEAVKNNPVRVQPSVTVLHQNAFYTPLNVL